MKNLSRSCISVSSKKNTPTKDPQSQKVYNMDDQISKLIKKKTTKIDLKKDFFENIDKIFNENGMTGFRIENNKSRKVSNINTYRKILTFSENVIREKNYEVVLHELAHGLCRYRGGYQYSDAHGEVFVYFLFSLIKDYFDVNDIELESLAEQNQVSYFYDFIIEDKEINEKEYKIFLTQYSNILKDKSIPLKEHLYENKIGYLINEKSFVSLFKNDGRFFFFKRKMFKFEEIIHITSFEKYSFKELNNFYIISPPYKTDISGYPTNNGTYFNFSFVNMESGKSGQVYKIQSDKKTHISKQRKEIINEYKRKGYNVLSYTDMEQYIAVQNFYIKALEKFC